MLGPRITTVFASRWKALWWSAGVLLTAYCSVPKAQDEEAATPAQEHPAKAHKPANPWALSPAQHPKRTTHG